MYETHHEGDLVDGTTLNLWRLRSQRYIDTAVVTICQFFSGSSLRSRRREGCARVFAESVERHMSRYFAEECNRNEKRPIQSHYSNEESELSIRSHGFSLTQCATFVETFTLRCLQPSFSRKFQLMDVSYIAARNKCTFSAYCIWYA